MHVLTKARSKWCKIGPRSHAKAQGSIKLQIHDLNPQNDLGDP